MSHDMIFYDESSTLTDEMLEDISRIMRGEKVKQPSWFKRHEFALWFAFVVGLLALNYYIFSHPDLLWRMTDPIVKLLGGTQ